MINNDKQLFSEKLKSAMAAKNFPVKAAFLEKEFNLQYYGKPVSIQGVSKWLNGKSIPRADKILVLAKWLEVEPSELVYGVEIKEKIQKSKQQWQENIGYKEREVFEAFLNLPAPQKKVIREVILAFSRAYSG